jgi:hypothetical protein
MRDADETRMTFDPSSDRPRHIADALSHFIEHRAESAEKELKNTGSNNG